MGDGELETLIEPSELAPRLGDRTWAVIDCRFDLADTARGEKAFREGHIPGARYAHLDRDLSGPVTPASGRHPLPEPDALVNWLGANGIGNQTRVVAYDDSGGTMAVRLWWLLRWLGHEAVALLDGGWPAWVAAGLPVVSTVEPPRVAAFSGTPDMSMVVTTEDLAVGRGPALLVDVRTAERFRGDREPIDAVAGHIPGAVNLPLQRHLAPDGRFLPAARLREIYEPLLNGRSAAETAFMCGSGVTACHGILALERAGMPGARLYAGSWSEWFRDPARPVVLGQD